jgi:hypothetical protein
MTTPSKPSMKRKFEGSIGTPSKIAKTSNSPVIRHFQDSWLTTFPFLSYNANKKEMICKLCVKCQYVNTFTSGCNVLKKESITKHMKTKGIHGLSLIIFIIKNSVVNVHIYGL